MDKKQAQKVAQEIVEYLFLDNSKSRKPVARLMLVYGGEEYKNPGWGRESVRDAVIDHIVKPPNPASTRPLVGSAKKAKSKSSTSSVKPAGTPSGG